MLSKDVAKKVRQIEIHTRRLLNGALVGDNRSALKGTGLDFDQIREYQEGDDVRFIDWNSSARMNKLLVKQYIEERSRTIILAVDVSQSGLFSSSHTLKRDVMAEVAGVLALVADYGNDHVALLLFSDEVELFIPPSKGKAQIHVLMEKLFSFKPKSKKTNITSTLKHLALLKKKDAVVFLISDFVDTGFEKLLAVVAKKYDCIAVRCLDTHERGLPSVGFLTVEDSETGQLVTIDTRRADDGILSHFFKKRISVQDTMFKKYGIDCLELSNKPVFIGDIIRFFRRRMRY